jgi:hypothetical protein
MAFYLLIGIAGVVALTQGQPMGWIAVGGSIAGIGLRVLVLWFLRWARELTASEAARRAEPGYVAPIVDPAELSRRRIRYMQIMVFGFIGPSVVVAIAASWFALVSTGDLQRYAVVIAFAMLLVAGATARAVLKGLKRIRDSG